MRTSKCLFQASSLAVTIRVFGLYRNSGSSLKPRHMRNFFRALSALLIKWLFSGYAACLSRNAIAALSQAPDLKLWFSLKPSCIDSQRERKKVASNARFQLKRGVRLSAFALRRLTLPGVVLSSSDMLVTESKLPRCSLIRTGMRSCTVVAEDRLSRLAKTRKDLRSVSLIDWLWEVVGSRGT
jgi:hypothetical protein